MGPGVQSQLHTYRSLFLHRHSFQCWHSLHHPQETFERHFCKQLPRISVCEVLKLGIPWGHGIICRLLQRHGNSACSEPKANQIIFHPANVLLCPVCLSVDGDDLVQSATLHCLRDDLQANGIVTCTGQQ